MLHIWQTPPSSGQGGESDTHILNALLECDLALVVVVDEVGPQFLDLLLKASAA